MVPVVGLECRVVTATRGRDRQRHGIGKVENHLLRRRYDGRKLHGLESTGYRAPVAREEEQKIMKMTKEEERRKEKEVCQQDSKTQTIMHFIIKAMVSRGAKEKFGQAPA